MTRASGQHRLTTQILVAMLAGGAFGVLLNLMAGESGWLREQLVDGLLDAVGDIFVNLLKMLVVPLVLVSLVAGITSLGNLRSLGRIGLSALLLYLFTTAVAISIALALATLVGPGAGLDPPDGASGFTGAEAPPLSQVFVNMVPGNPIQAMASGNMLQVIVFAIFFGMAVTMAGQRGQGVLHLVRDLDVIILHMVEIIMRLAPIGVFALIAESFANQGLDLILPLASYFLTLSTALLLHALITYPVLLRLFTGLSPVRFLKKMRDPATFAFSTASSAATIPVTLRTVEARMGVNNGVASFTVPLGATINMDGTAMMQGVATVFVAHVYGIDLGVAEYLTVLLVATLASIGTAAVPGVGLVMLTMVFAQVNLPVEGIALIIGVDRILDMMRTTVNVTGDCAVSCIIAHRGGQLDRAVFDDPQAGSVETALGRLAAGEATPSSRGTS